MSEAEATTTKVDGKEESAAIADDARSSAMHQTEATSASDKDSVQRAQSDLELLQVQSLGMATRGVHFTPCRFFFEEGRCLRGDRCPFSHGPKRV